MPLYVRDERVNLLAEKAQKVLKALTKTDAIRQALERVLKEEEQRPPLAERLEALRARYAMPAYEALDPFDQKAFLDEMWGDDGVHR
ncbi:type II toxin-antitoxin system VapB family antitoxin [Peteryoungia ipomoeae]|uniref:Antitoxin VapB n=1 Tax=Peteryoungia ipomoeae TaxID=1210932 RepID=A0A4S8PBZ0_9HYPH|nr:type II toxin-antitoxin system VapB family antitoxin [Peteryoungia ipomoeae]THV25669.1 hypothetical protein FAA97_05650 [Peteryoungia ipomoeae]